MKSNSFLKTENHMIGASKGDVCKELKLHDWKVSLLVFRLVEIVEVKDASKGEFRRFGVGAGQVWVELKDLESMKHVAEELGVKIIYRKEKEYFFRVNDITHYCRE